MYFSGEIRFASSLWTINDLFIVDNNIENNYGKTNKRNYHTNWFRRKTFRLCCGLSTSYHTRISTACDGCIWKIIQIFRAELKQDSLDYQESLLAVTYLAVADKSVISYFCPLNDKLAYFAGENKKDWNKLNRKVNNYKWLMSYPAVKIGRLGMTKSLAGQGIGHEIIDYIKVLFSQSNKTGCHFLTVDAHKDEVGFYVKCGFSFFTDNDRDEDTRLMYFDLKPFKDVLETK